MSAECEEVLENLASVNVVQPELQVLVPRFD